MTVLYRARWVIPVTSNPIAEGAIAVAGDRIAGVGRFAEVSGGYPEAQVKDMGDAVIIPGLINSHTHLELTAMRGFLDEQESDFFAWLKKLTMARLERMTPDDLYVSAAWGACEAARAGVTCVADASDAAEQSMTSLRHAGLRGIVYQESFGPDPRLAHENFVKLQDKVARLRRLETPRVGVGVSPHAAYTVCATQLEMISEFALAEKLPLMIHTAESESESQLLSRGLGPFAEGFAQRGIAWTAPNCSSVRYLEKHGVLRTRPLLAHCINVEEGDLEAIRDSGAGIAHCPKSNAKLSHGRAPWARFRAAHIPVGLGSDSVASNNTCDILEEARFALLLARAGEAGRDDLQIPKASDALEAATIGGARAMGRAAEIGSLEQGKQADFAVVSCAGTHQNPIYDPVGSLIFSSSGSDVMMTVVAGQEIFRDGCLTTLDEAALRARMDKIAEKLGQLSN